MQYDKLKPQQNAQEINNQENLVKRNLLVRFFSSIFNFIILILINLKNLFNFRQNESIRNKQLTALGNLPNFQLIKEIKNSTKPDWLNVLNSLQQQVRNLELGIDCLDSKSMTFDVLGASTYLLQMDILIAKNRQNFKTFERLERNFDQSQQTLELEFIKVKNAFIECYKVHIELLNLIQGRKLNQLNGSEILSNIQLLEICTRNQNEAIAGLNDFVLKKAPLAHLFENELFRTLQRVEFSKKDINFGSYAGVTQINQSAPTTQALRDSTFSIRHSEFKLISLNLITYYESLKHYYIFMPGKLLQDLTTQLRNNIQEFIEESKSEQPDKEVLFGLLNRVFASLEAVRFIPHSRLYQSRYLHEKARNMRKQLRSFLTQTQLGQEFLEKNLQISVKDKLILKQKF